MENDHTAAAARSDLAGVTQGIAELSRHIDDKAEETQRHFDVVGEQIRKDLKGANRDEIEVLNDAKEDHGQRV